MITSILTASLILSAPFGDVLYPKQWHLENKGQIVQKDVSELSMQLKAGKVGADLNFVKVDSSFFKKEQVIVAVIDSGIDVNHPDLVGRIVPGANLLDGSSDVTDDTGHGTHVAGIIAANWNDLGVAGIAPDKVKIMPLKVVSNQTNDFIYKDRVLTDYFADAIIFAINSNVDVINMSMGWPKILETNRLKQAFLKAKEKGIIIVASSGNNNKEFPVFPCGYDNVICVGATDNQGQIADFSNWGNKVDLLAPGEAILSTIPTQLESRMLRIKNFDYKKGSSQAGPMVAAIVATMKGLNPEQSVDLIKARLFSSAHKVDDTQMRFVNFGSVDMKAALLNQAPKVFVSAQLKNISEQKISLKDKSFQFHLPIKNFLDDQESVRVCLSFENAKYVLESSCQDLILNGHAEEKLSFLGHVDNLKIDSHVRLKINMTTSSAQFDQQATLTFSIGSDHQLASTGFKIKNARIENLGIFEGERRTSRITKIFDRFKVSARPEFFYLDKKSSTEEITSVNLIQWTNSEYQNVKISLPKVNSLMAIFRGDFDRNGVPDFMFYTIDKAKQNIVFYFVDQSLNPLFGKLKNGWIWKFPISEFEGLPIQNGIESVSWFEIDHPSLGKILVPTFVKNFKLEDEDNVKKLLDRDYGQNSHLFYLNPQIENEELIVHPRVLDNAQVVLTLKQQLKVNSATEFGVGAILPQTREEVLSGKIRSLYYKGSALSREYYQITWRQNTYLIEEIDKRNYQSQFNHESLMSSIDTQTGLTTEEVSSMNVLTRTMGQVDVLKENHLSSQRFSESNYRNPILGKKVMAKFTSGNQDEVFMIENRYDVQLIDRTGKSYSLPLNRESSFPGTAFSDLFQPIVIDSHPGLFVKQSMIYGERVSAMIWEDNRFYRPLYASVLLPQNCVMLSSELNTISASYEYAWLCKSLEGDPELVFFAPKAE